MIQESAQILFQHESGWCIVAPEGDPDTSQGQGDILPLSSFLDLALAHCPALASSWKPSCVLVPCTQLLDKLSIHRFHSGSLSWTFILHLVLLTSSAAASLAAMSPIFVFTPTIRLNAFHSLPNNDLQALLL